MVQAVDVDVVDCQDPVPDVEPPAALGGAAADDAPDGGTGARHRGDDDEAKALVLQARDGHIVRVRLGSGAAATVV